jgi:putative oxygen-independent coproporphyrinogen III oxidase
MPTTIIPLSLYIHIPWCLKKCPYCDFNSHNKPQILPFEQYFAHLLQDFLANQHFLQQRKIYSIFIGGGTPSLAPPKYYAWLFKELREHCEFADNIEITMELNPGTHEYHNLEDYFAAGINRISVGAQSFNNTSLTALGRIHNNSDTLSVIEKLKHKNFNIDLMHTLPNQSLHMAIDDLQLAINLNPAHLSWYQLTIEENTYFAKHQPILPSEKLGFEIYTQGLELLEKSGYERYEVSAFAKVQSPTMYCQHNLNYWQYGDYLGIGCGAHGKITTNNFEIIRTAKVKHPQKYMDANHEYTSKQQTIEKAHLPFEFFVNAARLITGFNLELFAARTNLPLASIMPQLQQAQAKQLITIDNHNLQLTSYGKLFVNELVELFL